MSTKTKSTNSLTELLEKSKRITTNICIPENKLQKVDEKKILRPYLEPGDLNATAHIEHISSTYRAPNEHFIEHFIEHISNTYRAPNGHQKPTYRTHIEH